MKKSIGILAILLCATLAQALPQENGQSESAAPTQMRPDAMSRLVDGLTLSEEQRQEIAQIRKKTVEDNASFFEAQKRTREEARAALAANDTAKLAELKATLQSQREELQQLRDAELAKIMDILTREQHIQFDELKAELDAQRGGQK